MINFKKLMMIGLAMATMPTFAQNPIIRNQFSADPTARVFNGKIYLYPSHDIPPASAEDFPRKDWFCMEDYHVFSSENMTEWTDHGKIFDQKQVPWGKPDAYSMWAPDCIEKDGKYYFYFPDAPKTGFGFGIGVAVADNPEGPYTVLDKNIEGISGIDPCVLQASDGNSYIFWGAGRCAKLKDNMIELAEDTPTEIVKFGDREFKMTGVNCLNGLPSRQAEGPFAFEYNGNYYLTYPYVRNNTEVIGYAMSKNPMGPYEYKGLILEEWPDCWTIHQSVVNYKGQWYLFYHHNNYSPNFDKSRSACVDSLFFNPDGTIQQVKPTLRGVGINKATEKIQIDRYSSISDGASISYLYENNADTTKRFEGWKTTFAKAGSYVQYNRVDFEQGAAKVIINYKSAKGGKVTISDLKGNVITEVKLKGNNQFTEQTFPVKNSPKGICDLKITAQTQDIEIDWISFK
ncbi:MAG: family 43 glycosylhydrolase [Bacteroidales bacterium]|nr:family 43 glycosylhydrolase [Bacteroidales bacterium]